MIKKIFMDTALELISKNPEENLPKALKLLDDFGWGYMGDVSTPIHKVLDDKDNVWHKYIMNIWKDIDINIIKSIFSNIHDKTLLEGLQSPLFMSYRKNQPFNFCVVNRYDPKREKNQRIWITES